MSLSGKRVVILGGTSGIGLATAGAAQRAGAAIVVVSSRKERVESAVAALAQGAQGEIANLSDAAQMEALFARIGAFDHLVFTAGENLQLATLETLPIEQARAAFDLRYWGAFMAAKYGAPQIRPGGSITLTTGVAGLRPRKGWTVASSICGAVESLTRALAVELAPLRVNAVCPGLVRTELWGEMAETARETMYRDAGQRLPVGRIGEAEDLARTYLYLMEEGFSTGQVIVVDGGAVLV
jgi:NAD(P)-dependent dehydrogenase (short-subunit alcohol dehydrogenase family)